MDPMATILMSEPGEIRRQFALEHGVTQVFDPTKGSVPLTVKTVVAPGVDLAFDAAGIQASLDACLFSLRPRGTYVNVAIWETTATINVNFILSRELNLTGTCYIGSNIHLLVGKCDFPQASWGMIGFMKKS